MSRAVSRLVQSKSWEQDAGFLALLMHAEHEAGFHSCPGNHYLPKVTIKDILSHLLKTINRPHIYLCIHKDTCAYMLQM